MGGHASSPQARNAASYLRFFLQNPYRDRWDRPEYVERSREANVHHGAVAQVLAEYLWSHPRRASDRDILGSQLEPLVSRALTGRTLSKQTLALFVSAFRMSREHAEDLWELWSGRRFATVLVGQLAPPEQVPGYRLREYDILMLHEHHWLGADGLPSRHHTRINLRSRVADLLVYQYRFDTAEADVRTARRSGNEVGPVYRLAGEVFAVDLKLDRPLRIGEHAYLEFWTILKYSTPPRCEMRRATHERINDFYMRVTFHPDMLPSKIWWAHWAHYQGVEDRVIDCEPYMLDGLLYADRHLTMLERAVAGFMWEWRSGQQ